MENQPNLPPEGCDSFCGGAAPADALHWSEAEIQTILFQFARDNRFQPGEVTVERYSRNRSGKVSCFSLQAVDPVTGRSLGLFQPAKRLFNAKP